jgi:hypothetical protein
MEKNEQTLLEALDVWNEAIQRHREAFPYREILPKCEEALRDKDIGVEIHEAHPTRATSRFTLRFEDGQIRPVQHNPVADVMWRVSRESLRDIAENRQYYLDRPVKLDWNWLTYSAGISA